MSEWTVDRAAGVLLEAEAAGTDRPPITDEWPGLDLATAYAVQDETPRRRPARRRCPVGPAGGCRPITPTRCRSLPRTARSGCSTLRPRCS